MFRELRSVKVSHDKQGLIYFTCKNYADQPEEMQKKILNLCVECGGDYYQELFEIMTTHKSITSIAINRYVSESTLYRLRKKFYESW